MELFCSLKHSSNMGENMKNNIDKFIYRYLEEFLEQTSSQASTNTVVQPPTPVSTNVPPVNTNTQSLMRYGLPYYKAIRPKRTPEENRLALIKHHTDKWADSKGKYTRSSEDIAKELMGMGPEGHTILGHEVIHALQRKKSPHMLKGSTELGPDMTKDKFKYLSLPSEIMAFAYSYVQGDKKYYDTYKKIGGNVFKLYSHYIRKYQKMKERGLI